MAFIPHEKQILLAGRLFDENEMANMVILYGFANTATRYATLRTANGTAGYQVPNGKTLSIKVISVMASSGVLTAAQTLYGDTDVGFDSAAAPTSAVTLAATGSSDFGLAQHDLGSSLRQGPILQSLDFSVPQNKFPAIRSVGATTTVICYGVLT